MFDTLDDQMKKDEYDGGAEKRGHFGAHGAAGVPWLAEVCLSLLPGDVC